MSENSINILIVAEDSQVRTALKNAVHLAQTNASTTVTDNIMTAIKECRHVRFDCIFLDRHLPANSFVEFMNQLYEVDTRAAVCMLINSNAQDLREEAFYHGALDFISKTSITIKTVSSCIKHSLDYRSTGAAGY